MSDNLPEGTTDGEFGPASTTEHVVDTRQGMWGSGGSGDTSGYGGLVRQVLRPKASVPPYGSWFDEVVSRIEELVPGAIEAVVVDRGELTLHVHGNRLLELAQPLRDDARLRFEACVSVSGVHYPGDTGSELHSVYHFLSMTHVRRLRVEAACSDAHPHLPSIVPVYPAADWHERETYDLFGIIYDGHPALTRIMMPDDWPGHPQRKDYPLGGIPVEYKGATIPPPDQRRSY
ncbi:MAG: NADH-quinone oxidoreductase subunit C [Propionibacteriaceae bacterium]|nr:NADH-quinone oxidoreductase subunit C [Propionibacteriaceae bacterium]